VALSTLARLERFDAVIGQRLDGADDAQVHATVSV